jgi:hypothetical protein
LSVKARKAFDKLHAALYSSIHNEFDALDRLTEFLAVDNCPPLLLQFPKDIWFLKPENEWLQKTFEVYDKEMCDMLRADWDDELGNMYMDMQSNSIKGLRGQFLTPIHVSDMMAQMVMGVEKKPETVLDPCVGTGRMLMSAAKVNPEARMYGVDIDHRGLHITLVNAAQHNIHAFVLHADSLLHDTDPSHPNGRFNWKHANQWQSHFGQLKTIMDPQIEEKLSENVKAIETVSTYKVKAKDGELDMELVDINNPEAVARRRMEIYNATVGNQEGVASAAK